MNFYLKVWENSEDRDWGESYEVDFERSSLEEAYEYTETIYENISKDGGAVELYDTEENLLYHLSEDGIERY